MGTKDNIRLLDRLWNDTPLGGVAIDTDLDVLNAARNRVAYEPGYTNTLVEWTMGDGWTTPTPVTTVLADVSGEVFSVTEGR